MAEEKVNSGASTMITIAVFFILTIGTMWYAKTLWEAKNAECVKAEREVRDGYMAGSIIAVRMTMLGEYEHLVRGSNINWVAGDIQSNCIAGLANNPYR